MTILKTNAPFLIIGLVLAFWLGGCQPATEQTQASSPSVKKEETATSGKDVKMPKTGVQTLVWEDLMPAGEDKLLAELYSEFYEEREMRMIEQITSADPNQSKTDLMSIVKEGSAQDTMEQIGTYNVVEDLNGKNIRIPGYVVPLDFKASSEYG